MQTEKAGISRKEKRLLTAAAVLGFFYLAFQFGFLPLYNDFNEKAERRDELSEQKQEVEMRLGSEAAVLAEHENAREAYLKIEETFLQAGITTDLSRMLTDLCRRNGFDVFSQNLGDPADFRIPGEDVPEGASAFATVTASMSVSGNYAAIKNLLDEVEREPYINIGNISFSPDHGESGGEYDRVSVTFVVTLLNGIG